MDVFLEFLCTIVLSVLLSFFISKLLSWDPTGDHAEPELDSSTPGECHVADETGIGDCKTEENSTSFGKKRTRFADDELTVHEEEEVAVVDGDGDGDGDVVNDPVFDDLKVRWMHKRGEVVGVDNFEEVVVCGVEEKLVKENVGDCVNVIDDNLVDESPDRMKFREIATKSANDEVKNVVDDKERLFGDDDVDDDWEGIERSELEKQFEEAAAFVRRRSDSDCISELGSDVQMQLYGLHKVATEGPCNEPQPMAFKVSARAKWHAWQQLGNISPEAAMEQYINLLSQNIPVWFVDYHGGNSEQSFSDAGASSKLSSDVKNVSCNLTI